jgi:hypothetical protein
MTRAKTVVVAAPIFTFTLGKSTARRRNPAVTSPCSKVGTAIGTGPSRKAVMQLGTLDHN